jgi:hypothetical protein
MQRRTRSWSVPARRNAPERTKKVYKSGAGERGNFGGDEGGWRRLRIADFGLRILFEGEVLSAKWEDGPKGSPIRLSSKVEVRMGNPSDSPISHFALPISHYALPISPFALFHFAFRTPRFAFPTLPFRTSHLAFRTFDCRRVSHLPNVPVLFSSQYCDPFPLVETMTSRGFR